MNKSCSLNSVLEMEAMAGRRSIDKRSGLIDFGVDFSRPMSLNTRITGHFLRSFHRA